MACKPWNRAGLRPVRLNRPVAPLLAICSEVARSGSVSFLTSPSPPSPPKPAWVKVREPLTTGLQSSSPGGLSSRSAVCVKKLPKKQCAWLATNCPSPPALLQEGSPKVPKLNERRKQIQEYNAAEAARELNELRIKLFNRRLQQQRGEVKNNRVFTQTRKDIARLLHRLTQLEAEE